jgi:hypothetical protein
MSQTLDPVISLCGMASPIRVDPKLACELACPPTLAGKGFGGRASRSLKGEGWLKMPMEKRPARTAFEITLEYGSTLFAFERSCSPDFPWNVLGGMRNIA